MDNYNVFLPTGDAKIGDIDYALDSNSMFDYPVGHGRHPAPHRPSATSRSCETWRRPRTRPIIQTNVVRIDGKREVYIPVFRQLGSSTLARGQQRSVAAPRIHSSSDSRRASS